MKTSLIHLVNTLTCVLLTYGTIYFIWEMNRPGVMYLISYPLGELVGVAAAWFTETLMAILGWAFFSDKAKVAWGFLAITATLAIATCIVLTL